VLLDDGRLAGVEAVAAMVAGSFANLLAPILGSATLLDEELPEGHPARRRVDGIKAAAVATRAFAQRLALLDPKRKVALRAVEVSELLRGCLDEVRDELGPGLAVESSPTELAELVHVDRQLIARAFVELARNAQEATGGAAALRLDVSQVEGGAGKLAVGRWVRLRVADRGPGLELAKLERAFEPFVTSKVPASGAGLGLSIVAAIVRRHGGLVEVASSPGAGTAISILLPSEGRGARERERTPAAQPVAAVASGSGAAVLLVEDNPMVRRSIEATLRLAGFRVTSVDSGRRCIETVGEPDRPIDLLISDVVMPEMTGEEMIGRVHELRPELPVLLISGYDRATLARRKHPLASTEHFLQKPFDSEDLFAAVRKAMTSRPGQPGG